MVSRIFESRFFEGLSKFVDILLLGLYFIICSIPIFTMGASLTALYYAVNKVIYQGRGYTTAFFHSFKENFKQSTLSWLIFMLLSGLCGLDIFLTRRMLEAGDKMGGLGFIFIILLAFLFLWSIYHFSYIARFSNGFKASFKVSGVLLVIHFPTTLLMLVIAIVFAVVCFVVKILIPFAPAFFFVAVRPLLEKIYRKYMTEEDQEREVSFEE